MQGSTWEESRRELVQGHGHDFGCEAEGIFHTCSDSRRTKKNHHWSVKQNVLNLDWISSWSEQTKKKKVIYLKRCIKYKSCSASSLSLVWACTISVMQVNVHIKDSLVFLPQPEDSQHSIVHITETRRLIPAKQRGGGGKTARLKSLTIT